MIGSLRRQKHYNFFSSIIHDIVNYYLFVKKHSSLCHNIIVNDGKIYIFKFKRWINFLKNNNNSFCQCGNWPKGNCPHGFIHLIATHCVAYLPTHIITCYNFLLIPMINTHLHRYLIA